MKRISPTNIFVLISTYLKFQKLPRANNCQRYVLNILKKAFPKNVKNLPKRRENILSYVPSKFPSKFRGIPGLNLVKNPLTNLCFLKKT